MADITSNQRLGRGLAALLGDNNATPAGAAKPDSENSDLEHSAQGHKIVPIGRISVNPSNPRRHFDNDELDELASSLKQQGMLQPILVRSVSAADSNFQIVAGERRWRAAQRAGIADVPIIVKTLTDQQALEIAIVENVQRSDLNPIEEAHGYAQLIEEFRYSQAELGDIIGKSRSHVANILRLSKLPERVQNHLRDGLLTMGHARALIGVEGCEDLADRIVREGFSVRATEQMVQRLGQSDTPATNKPVAEKKEKSSDVRDLEEQLATHLGLNVILNPKKRGGDLILKYKTLDQLDAVINRLKSQ